MLRKLPAFVLFAFSSCTIIYSQKTPEPAKQPDKTVKAQTWNFQFDGGSYLGIEPQEITRDNFGKFGLSGVRGVAVEKIVENSPAAQAGLQTGDVIVKVDGTEVESVRKLTRLISEVAPDHQVRLTVLRGGSEQEINATMGKREVPEMFNGNFKMPIPPNAATIPNIQVMPKISELPKFQMMPPEAQGNFIWKNDGDSNAYFFGSSRQIGVNVTSLSKQLGEYFGISDGRGLLISNVHENSPAAKAGLKAGDVIVEVDDKEIKNNVDLIRTINEKKEGSVQLTIIRDRNRQTMQITPENLKSDVTPLFEQTAPTLNVQPRIPQMQTTPFTITTPLVAPILPKRVL